MPQQIKIFNNLTRSKEDFKPIEDGKVRYYSCGPTTYDFLHVGNARALVVGDLFNRVFNSLGYETTFVRNFTDVDDKIIERANELGVDAIEHADRFVNECLQDMQSLGMKPADHMPKVSETLEEIVKMIQDILDHEAGYEVDGEVFFHVPAAKDYGKLSKKDLESLQHGIRVEVDSRKKHPSDFVLWKPAKEGEPAWDSPWGKGRPGWHIECSAMSKKYLGCEIDIHHGGVDLMFPHHENEIAQSEAANNCQFSRYWVHHEFVNFGSEKMSKSLGNVVTIRKFIETYSGEVLRHLLASVHYRAKIDWTEEMIQRSLQDVERIHQFVLELEKANASGEDATKAKEILSVIDRAKEDLANDFNTPGALSHLFVMIRDIRREFLDKKTIASDVLDSVKKVLSFYQNATGLIHDNAQEVLERVNMARKSLSGSDSKVTDEEIEKLIVERKEARATKNWARADEIRDFFKENKIELLDNPDGTTSWKYK